MKESIYVGLQFVEISGREVQSPAHRVTLDSFDVIIFDMDHSNLLDDWERIRSDFSTYCELVAHWREEIESSLAHGATVIVILASPHGDHECDNHGVLRGLRTVRKASGSAVRAEPADPFSDRLLRAAEAASSRFSFEGKIEYEDGTPLLYSGKSESAVAMRAAKGPGTLFLIPRPDWGLFDGSTPMNLDWLIEALSESTEPANPLHTADGIAKAVASFLANTHLYSFLDLGNAESSLKLMQSWPSIEVFCVQCNSMRPFRPASRESAQSKFSFYEESSPRIIELIYKCTAEEEHTLLFFLRMANNGLEKIGQLPSAADLQRPLPGQLRRRFPKDCEDIARAKGLAAHGIGAGSFVYLRRVIERLLRRAESQTVRDGSASPADLSRLRVSERFHALAPTLPPMIASDPTIYALLSAGVHELDEKTCRDYFPVLLDSVLHVLHEELSSIETSDRAKKLKSKLLEMKGDHASTKAQPGESE